MRADLLKNLGLDIGCESGTSYSTVSTSSGKNGP